MEQIYSNIPPDKIPWNLKQPPGQLIELVETGKITPCRAVDLGCGTGNYAIWLASKGFEVTGIDFSKNAIEMARKLAERGNANCLFMVEDLTVSDFIAHTEYEFAFDWEVLHHVFPGERDTYIGNVAKILQPGATYYSVCFSELDPDFGGEGKYRNTPLGTTLYFSSEQEIEHVLKAKFKILELNTTEIAGKYGPHMAVVALASKK